MNYFKFLKRSIIGVGFILSLLMSTLLVACSNNQPTDEPDTPPGSYDVTNYWFDGFIYHYHPDSIVSADAHELTFYTKKMRHDYHWDKTYMDITLWDYDAIDGYGIKGDNAGAWKGCDFKKDGNTLSYDWISFELVINGEEYWVNVHVKPNDTGKERCARFEITEYPEVYLTWRTTLIVTQKPVIDDTPFEIKARYKENIYSTQAHLDSMENLVFEDTEFSEMMKMLQNREDIECVILEDGIIDYFDNEDMKSNPILNALTTRASMVNTPELTRSGCPNHSENLHNGYRFMDSDAVGYFGLFDDTNFKDTYFAKSVTSKYTVFDLPYTGDAGLENKISSVALAYEATDKDVCAVLTLWEDGSYNFGDIYRKSHRISLIATPSHPHVWHSNLKNVPCLNSSQSWNDRISSCSFHFGILGTSFKDY
ncbi:MAG: hypothetical protein K2J29_06715 [Muribaculaceae bacterium]|nr:hypothetical protein [Muribaculaceae bacterium]